MSDEVDLVTWLRDVADMKARVYIMEFEAKRFRACADELAELRKENERLSASLKLIAQMGGLTLLGPSDGDYDGLTKRLPDQYWAHELGAARAFSQAADVAKEALKDSQ